MSDVGFLKEELKRLKKVAAQSIPLAYIFEKENVRKSYSEESLKELGESIRAVGLQSPITVVEVDAGRYEVEFGHRRFLASKIAGLDSIACFVKESDEAPEGVERIAVQLIENIQREDLSDADLEDALVAMIESGIGAEALAKRLGKSYSWVYKYTSAHEKRKALSAEGIDAANLSTFTLTKLPADKDEAVTIAKGVVAGGENLTAATVEAARATRSPAAGNGDGTPPSHKAPVKAVAPKAPAKGSLEGKIRALYKSKVPDGDFRAGFNKALDLVVALLEEEKNG